MMALLVQGLRDLGYRDGDNIVLIYRSAEKGLDTLPTVASELITRPVDVLYAVGPAAVWAATKATKTIPIVAVDLESDPVANGWIHSFPRPEGNLTGFFLDLPELAAKWLQLLREADADVKEIGILWDSATGRAQLDAVTRAAQGSGIRLRLLSIRSANDLDRAISAAAPNDVKALVILSSPIFDSRSLQIAALTLKNRLPAISPFRQFAEQGGLMAYGPDLQDFFRRAPATIAKIIEGRTPGEVPVEQPTTFQLLVNLKTAKLLGLQIPQTLLVRANDVIR
jgi:ABC-type uncharacterized transport system substrate-binding protein